MMALVVNRNDRGDGLAGSDAEKIFKGAIPTSARKGSAMDVIMFDNAGDEREDAINRQQQPMTKHAAPLKGVKQG